MIPAVHRALRKRLPTANELVHDNYNFFIVGHSATERPPTSGRGRLIIRSVSAKQRPRTQAAKAGRAGKR